MLAVQSSTFVIGPIAKLLGYIINILYIAIDSIGLGNIVLSIILFTLVVQLLMIPIKYKAQKFTRVSSLIQPEINEIRKKYAGKRDQQSMALMQAETQEVYKKYGASPAGGCLPMLIQMPILFALYVVIQNIPSYVGRIYDLYAQVADKITPASVDVLNSIKAAPNLDLIVNSKATLVDYFYTYNMTNWNELTSKIADIPKHAVDSILNISRVLGDVLVSDTPWTLIKQHNYFHWIWILPILVYASAYFSMTTTQTKNTMDDDENPQARQMRTMSKVMPILSVVFCFALPVGLGIYWIVNSLVMGFQQIAMNRYIDSIGLENILQKSIEKNNERVQKSKEKKGLNPATVTKAAHMSTKNIEKEDKQEQVTNNDSSSISSLARLTDKYKNE